MTKRIYQVILSVSLILGLFIALHPSFAESESHFGAQIGSSALLQATPAATLPAVTATTVTTPAGGGGSSSGGFVFKVPANPILPPGQASGKWEAATGTINMTTSGTDNLSTVNFEAKGLIGYGLYSLWWIKPGEAITSAENSRALVFRADAQGTIATQFKVPASEANLTRGMVALYHPAGVIVGDETGAVGIDSFVQLTSPNLDAIPLATPASTSVG